MFSRPQGSHRLLEYATWACILLTSASAALALEPVQYNRDIRPILADNCFACHGLDNISREADLRLDLRDAAIDSGALIPGDPDNSELITRILTEHEDTIMPPLETKKTLTQDQRDLLVRWVKEGAAYEKHWAFIKPQLTPAPASEPTSWRKNEIDDFVLHRLHQKNLSPAEPATPHQLFRRLSLDIKGLPPIPEDIDAFVADYAKTGDKALSLWIDRLMKSTAWGEHRGRYWLDAARYADTHGMHFDNYREMWPYRDWVIRSFNQNQPFDQFTIEQLAGDLLENPSLEQRIATGFQRCAMSTNEGGTIDEENLATYASDRVQTFGWVYLGLTTNCCQCHDHKFDPLTMKDYYSLAAYFRNTTQPPKDKNASDGGGPVIRVVASQDRARWDAIDADIKAAKAAQETRHNAANENAVTWAASASADDFRNAIPTSGQIASIPMSEGTGNSVAVISSGNEVQANATGDLSWEADGKIGPALKLKLNATLDLGQFGDFAKSDPGSCAVWVRTSNPTPPSAIIARMDEKAKFRGWDLLIDNGRLAMHVVDSWPANALKVSTKDQVIKKNQWHHICVTWDGSGTPAGTTFYIDGVSPAMKTENNTLSEDADIHTSTPLRIGQRSHELAFATGTIQDLYLFDRKLSADEAVAIKDAKLMAGILETPADNRSEEQRKELLQHYLNNQDSEYAKLTKNVNTLEAEHKALVARSPMTHVQVERTDRMAMGNILVRGEYDNVGDEVMAAPPASLHPLDDDAPRNRLGLARWVIDSENPLTARVTVNRFWQEIFGQGIVTTSEDFGVMGAPPTHPELLDWLAIDFVHNGWDVKRFFKQIFMSATYRQAAITTKEKLAKDRDNQLYSRGPRFRMDAEMVRDHALSASGLLSPRMFGPGTRPYQPDDIWNMVGLPSGNTREYVTDKGEGLYRRSLYTFWKRMAPPPSLEAFNAPSREVCTVRRERTNTPLQALVTLNDPQYVEAARKLAELCLIEGNKQAIKSLDCIVKRVLNRPLTELETSVVMKTHATLQQHYESHPHDAAALLEFGETVANESINPTTLATWTMTCNQIMNLDEALNK